MRSCDLSGPIRGLYPHLQGDDVLFCVFLLVDDDAPVHKYVIKQEELQEVKIVLNLPMRGHYYLYGLRKFSYSHGEEALPHQHSTRHREGLKGQS